MQGIVAELGNFFSLFVLTDGQADPAKQLALAALVISAFALVRSWNWKPKPKIKFKTSWKEPEFDYDPYKAYYFEATNVGGAVALDVNVSVNSILDGPGGGLRAHAYGDTEMSALQPGESIHFTVHFIVEDYGLNPHHEYAPFRSEGLELKATYRVPPVNMKLHKKKTRIDTMLANLPVG